MVTVPPAIATAADLALCLEAESGAFLDFVRLLQTEQEVLIQGEVDKLIELARLKSEKVVQLSQFAERRSRFLASQGLEPSGGMEQWLSRHGADNPRLGENWKRLLERAKEAQHLNQTNGLMIETRLQHNQQALAVLQAAANQVSLYGPDGQARSTGLGRPLGKV